ncbi:multidrug effflux MFS transporter [Streptomyces olivaceus]|uniref:multidrug effflux MFS transporter n=1 Tax=Streptomyces olivaceus TaxID=47716 RepID=UPI001CCAF5EF|nr:multidrug effflux MFS transporter [Streptomyces olivaceus]MBZ6083671.1 multidrug effflux MFS transporter [Streptomyces olivaceus]
MADTAAPAPRAEKGVPGSVVAALTWLVALGLFASDLYLASLPGIGRNLDAPLWVTQLTLTGFLMLLGLGQFVAGPVTDAVGRRGPLLGGLVLFTGGSVLGWAAPDIGVLILARLLQGIGSAIGVVVSNSMVRDFTQGPEATRLYALLMSIAGFAPVVAPFFGGVIDQQWGWRAVFAVLALMGALAFVISFRFLPESLPRESRTAFHPASVIRSYLALFRHARFVRPLLSLLALFVVLFGYVGGAPYAYQEHYGLSPTAFGAVIGATGVAAALGPAIAHRLSRYLDGRTQAMLGTAVCVGGVACAAGAVHTRLPLAVVACLLAVSLIGLGIGDAPLFSSAMSSVDGSVGAASAVIGGGQYLLAAGVTAVTGPLASASPTAWLGVLVIAALVALACATRIGADDVPVS